MSNSSQPPSTTRSPTDYQQDAEAKPTSTRLLIVGAGGVGLIYAGLLNKLPNVDVSIYARSNYDSIKERGVRVNRPDNDAETFEYRPAELLTGDEPYKGAPFDFVIVSTKSLGTTAVSGLEKFIDPSKTLLLLFQNGIGVEQPYLEAYPGIAIGSAVVRVAASMNGPTEAVHMKGGMAIVLGLVHTEPGKGQFFQDQLALLKDISAEAGVDSSISTNITKSRWEKMLWNGTFNTLCSVVNLSTGELFSAGMEPLARKVMLEIWTVGRTIVGDEWPSEAHVDSLIDYTKKNVPDGFLPSTLQDVRKGNDIEIEAIVGNTIRAAKEHNVSVPTLENIYALLEGVNFKIKLQRSQC